MKYLFFTLLTILSISAKSQPEGSVYYFDADWKSIKSKNAVYLVYTHQVSDTCWQFDYYNVFGPMLRSIQYNDKKSMVKNGNVFYYTRKGILDSLGTYHNDKRDGIFLKTTGGDSVRWKWEYTYRNDSLISIVDRQKTDTTHYTGLKEAEYPGGTKAWYQYLIKNMVYPDRAVSNNIQGQVKILFIVAKDGSIVYPMIAHSVEYSLDQSALKVIANSGKWTPAFQNDHYVAAYKLQPMNFKLEVQK